MFLRTMVAIIRRARGMGVKGFDVSTTRMTPYFTLNRFWPSKLLSNRELTMYLSLTVGMDKNSIHVDQRMEQMR